MSMRRFTPVLTQTLCTLLLTVLAFTGISLGKLRLQQHS